MHHLDQMDSLRGGLQHLAFAHDIAALQQHLNDGGARGGRAQAGLLHGVRQFLLVERLARGFHGREQRALRESLGRTGLLLQGLHVHHGLRLALRQARRQRGRFRCALLAALRDHVQRLPTHLLHGRSGGVIVIRHAGIGNRRDDGGHRPDVIVMPRAEQAAADQIVDLALIGREIAGLHGRRDDGVVIGHLGIVDEAAAQRTLAGALRQQRVVRLLDGPHHGRQGVRHVLRKVAAIGARIADQLAALIERLRGFQGLLRAEAIKAIGMPLQFGEIVEQRRRHALRFGLDGSNVRRAYVRARHDPLRLFAIGREPHGHLDGILRCRRDRLAEPGTLILLIRDRRERRQHFHVIFRHEGPDRQLAFHQHGQRGRLHAANREFVVPRQRVGAREIHAHQPIGAAAPARGVGQRIVCRAVLQFAEALADGVGRERGNPEAAERLPACGGFVDVTENQLAFAAGVGGAHHRRHFGRVQDLAHYFELRLSLLVDHQRPVVRQHGEQIAPPVLPLRLDLVRLRQRHQVADGPSDHVAVAVQISLPLFRGAQHARDVARHGRLFRQDGHAGALRIRAAHLPSVTC